MCGIIGCIGVRNYDSVAKKLLETISHRGPDSSGAHCEDGLLLGHSRLSIQDLSPNGNQPMVSADGNFILIFNGEIYNHFEIRKELESKYTFRSSSDTETLLYAFAEYGQGILPRLNGIFAFAIYNKSQKEITVVRDHFGTKPLYYYQNDEEFLFGSEIKSFLSFTEFNKDLDYSALVNYLNYLWSPGEQTPFAKVKKVLPGHYIKIHLSKPIEAILVKYYEIPFIGKYSNKSESELILELEQKLLKALERQMLSDVPVGFFLSGGLDSSALVAMARTLYPQRKIQCFTIDTKILGKTEGFADDLHYAQLVADYLNVDLEIVKADINIVDEFDKMIYHLDEPQADPAPLNVFNISKRARKMGYKVLIGGTAGDDLFSGYRRHQALRYEKYLKWFSPLGPAIQVMIKRFKVNNPFIRRLRKLVIDINKSKNDRLKGYYSWLPLSINKGLFTEKVQREVGCYDPLKYLDKILLNIPQEKSDLNKMLYWEMKTFLPDHNLNYTDKMSMAVGVEVRVPFLDVELVEFSTLIPPKLKMKGITTKYLLKKVMEKYLPHEVIYRPKAGFGAPVRKWITEDLDDKINGYLSFDKLQERGIFNADAVWRLIADNKSGKIDASYSIWCLLAIESWMRQFVDP